MTSGAAPRSATPGAAIKVSGLEVVRGGRRVLRGVDVEVPAGTVTGLLGPSGCGKSTFIRAVVGVQVVAGGTVEVLGLPAGSAALRSRVGYVTQAQRGLRRPDGPREPARTSPRCSARRRRTSTGSSTRSTSPQRPTSWWAGLSGGQGNRASLATALLGRPELLVLDEPTVGLDPVLRRDLWALFRGSPSAGATLLVSSHVMDEAERCDRLLLMREGEFLADCTLPELLDRTGAADVEAAFLALVEGDRRERA